MLIFNEGSFPKFDVDDGAFAQRMLVMQHRSAFLKPDALASTSAPYTYLADEGLKGRLKAAPHKILAWMLQGVELYHNGRLDSIPQTMQQWRSNLAAEQDIMAQFITQSIAKEEGAHVALKELWDAFQASGVKKPAHKQAAFHEKCKAIMADGTYHRNTCAKRRASNFITGYSKIAI